MTSTIALHSGERYCLECTGERCILGEFGFLDNGFLLLRKARIAYNCRMGDLATTECYQVTTFNTDKLLLNKDHVIAVSKADFT